MIDLGQLRATINVDGDNATRSMEDFGKTTNNTQGRLKNFASTVGGVAKTALLGFATGVVAVGTAMIGVTAKALETTANIEKFSATCNVSTDEFQRLDGVFQTVGFSMEGASGDFAALSEKMLEASQTGEGEAYEMFQKLGVATTDASGQLRNTGDVFNDMVLSLQNVSDASERQAMASIMLGTTSEEIAPILAMTNEEFLKMKENVNVIDEEQLKQAEEFKKSWDNVKQTFGTLITEIGIKLMPIFQKLIEWIQEHMPQIEAIIDVTFGVVMDIFEAVGEAIEKLIGCFDGLLTNNEETSKELQKVWNELSEAFSEIWDAIVEVLSVFIEGCVKLWNEYGEEIMAIISPVLDWLKDTIVFILDYLSEVFKFWIALFTGDFDGMCEAVKNIFASLGEWILDTLEGLGELICGIGSMLFEAGANIFTSLWDGIKSVWDNIVKWVTDGINWLVDKITFWDNGSKKVSAYESNSHNGSHANGIAYIPTDNYKANLHKGERVLTAEQNRQYESNSTGNVESLLQQLNNKLDRLPRNLTLEQRFA